MVFSRGAQEPGLWWLPDTDVLCFKKMPQEGKKTTRLQSLQGLEHIKHISLASRYFRATYFLVGCYPKAADRFDGPNEQADIQMLRLGFRSLVDASACGGPRSYPEFFHGLRVLTVQYSCGHSVKQDSADEDCTNCEMSYHSSGRCEAAANHCCGAYGFRLGDMSIDDAFENAMQMENCLDWDEVSFFNQEYKSLSKGPIVATREGLTEASDQLLWFELKEHLGPL